jgi:hypothetical protein
MKVFKVFFAAIRNTLFPNYCKGLKGRTNKNNQSQWPMVCYRGAQEGTTTDMDRKLPVSLLS